MLYTNLTLLTCLIFILRNFPLSKTYPHDCTKFTTPFVAEQCCGLSHLFLSNYKITCSKYTSLCFYECVFANTKICYKNHCNYRRAVDYIDRIFNTNFILRDLYKTVFRKCFSKADGIYLFLKIRYQKLLCNPLPEVIYLCVEKELLLKCPLQYWNITSKECMQKKTFIENCLDNEDDERNLLR